MKETAEQRFKKVVNEIIDSGEYPGPTLINKKLNNREHDNHLNGRQTRWRRKVMTDRGVALKRPYADLPLTDYDIEEGAYL